MPELPYEAAQKRDRRIAAGASSVGPHEFEGFGNRAFHRPNARCRACYLPKREHPVRGWTEARPLGDKSPARPSASIPATEPADEWNSDCWKGYEGCRCKSEAHVPAKSPFPRPPDLTPGAIDHLTQREDGTWESRPATEPRCTCRNFGPHEYREVDPNCAVHAPASERLS